MTDKDIEALIQSCKARGLTVNSTDAGFIILAKKILKQASPDPSQATLAQEVLEDFAARLVTGGPSNTFAGFMLTDNEGGRI